MTGAPLGAGDRVSVSPRWIREVLGKDVAERVPGTVTHVNFDDEGVPVYIVEVSKDDFGADHFLNAHGWALRPA